MRSLLVALAALASLTACGTSTGLDTSGEAAPAEASPPTSDAPDQATESEQAAGKSDKAGKSDVRDKRAEVAEPTPEILQFTSQTLAGEAFAGEQLAGTPTVLWFWAPWCHICRGQSPAVGQLAERFGDEVDVVGVGSLDDSDAIRDFADEVSSEVTLLSDPDGAVWRHFGITAQSTYVVLDETGGVVASGYLSDDELVTAVDQIAS